MCATLEHKQDPRVVDRNAVKFLLCMGAVEVANWDRGLRLDIDY